MIEISGGPGLLISVCYEYLSVIFLLRVKSRKESMLERKMTKHELTCLTQPGKSNEDSYLKSIIRKFHYHEEETKLTVFKNPSIMGNCLHILIEFPFY